MEHLPYLWILIGYLVGSIPFGLIVGRMNGIDIRQHGSGNIGATNVLRVLGKPIGYTVLTLDIVKGLLPVLLARIFASDAGAIPNLIPVLTCIATILGHTFPIWLKFKGGKGISTSAGAILPLDPITCLIAVALWIGCYFATRIVSIGSLAAAISLPTTHTIQRLIDGKWSEQMPVLILMIVIWILATWRHRSNIRGLINGTEHRFEKKKKPTEGEESGA
ncbi:MAG: glycerol-3-phosphate acyltransferase PlsY [Verrucomicrobiales bacterium]|jgi:glycerol-3-phosphate acyltransferase PlsY